eukprot:433393-Pyramimonas_sp.AAC.1
MRPDPAPEASTVCWPMTLRVIGFNPLHFSGSRADDIVLACPNMDLILLAGAQAAHRKCEQILSRRVHGRLILEAEVADGP